MSGPEAEPGIVDPEAEPDIVAELIADHRELACLSKELSRPERAEDGASRRVVADRLTAALVAHAAAEEQYLFPAAREYLTGGHEFADAGIGRSRRVEELLKDLEQSEPTDAHFGDLSGQLADEIRVHAEDQEHTLFPALLRVCEHGILADLGVKTRQAKKSAPTRPHPAVPDNPVGSKIVAPGVGLVDRVRDFLSGRGGQG
ncbi:hemerythrin domain-containing protein [Yinghuangia soli]|uniref:Hemerythrin domain-containing protein n=1 Tax=Yinghuangia soli TaxID=2908204 RepID=A0AA41PZH5_9ACTN|nr:hemerythrin domain-containing protein [Yinghuangia soli]MCF2528788.1 hemerythrin domain-containing protein [Yinghuangia soli]